MQAAERWSLEREIMLRRRNKEKKGDSFDKYNNSIWIRRRPLTELDRDTLWNVLKVQRSKGIE